MWVDFHNHVIPGVDDGAHDPAQARAAVLALAEQGVGHVVASPHLDGSVTTNPAAFERRMEELDAGWESLTGVLDVASGVALGRGAEVKLDVPDPDLSDPRVRLAGSATVLVEFPYLQVPPRSAEVLAGIAASGYQPLLAHPERYAGTDRALAVVRSWVDAGAFLQINAGSLLGEYGPLVARRARQILAAGLAHCVASDYHAVGQPLVGRARGAIEWWAGEAPARRLFEDNPERLVQGEAALPVDPVRIGSGALARAIRWVERWRGGGGPGGDPTG